MAIDEYTAEPVPDDNEIEQSLAAIMESGRDRRREMNGEFLPEPPMDEAAEYREWLMRNVPSFDVWNIILPWRKHFFSKEGDPWS